MRSKSKRSNSSIITMIIAVVGLVLLAFNYQYLIDQVVVSQVYKPSQEVSQIADQIQFTPKGKFLFLAAQPELNSRSTFNKHCEKKEEQTVVLGCYIGPQHMYVYNVTDPRLSGVRQVTAAHEMLHGAYDRLSYSEKKNVNKMIEDALPSVQQADSDLAVRLKIYDKTEPGERNNELHSILGTEAANLPAELEDYYKQYFINRSIITTFASQYDKVFNDVKDQQDQLVAQLDALAAEINSLTDQYNVDTTKLNDDIENFNSRANTEGEFESQSEFNAARAELLAKRDALNAKKDLINTKISQYESMRAKLNDLNIQVKELNSKVDSTSVPSL
ncbi:hypothetical protein HY004_01530 [Candidatus Saccharibacteria bacterium]|nr:hypothetical protein [Candidatus Saccharibacteria bacterium]